MQYRVSIVRMQLYAIPLIRTVRFFRSIIEALMLLRQRKATALRA